MRSMQQVRGMRAAGAAGSSMQAARGVWQQAGVVAAAKAARRAMRGERAGARAWYVRGSAGSALAAARAVARAKRAGMLRQRWCRRLVVVWWEVLRKLSAASASW